ncbi:DUF3108 domain-containing protein [Candidatus Chrysopegis kryptomonas]|uniref:DUF3108 domain-containing protein n=1 Tax=Candidatus Chryseopegocella kryptomonas TaxID=1633643 RepID=A0A0P1MW12_9BACT|nr:DUF3108 domain-containing protein [Candidatus Chrysopegis kryptomonas]CUT00118.1 Protein of unknown function (DUF3108) [Candidatus Chrysopegis kryptomonas]
MKKILILTFLLCGFAFADDFKFSSEYLEYDVYWKFLNLGKIRVITKVEGDSIYSWIQVKSNPYIFFVNVDYAFESKFHKDSLYDAILFVYEMKDGIPLKTAFERNREYLVARQVDVRNGNLKGERSIIYPDRYYQGITAFFVARKLCGTGVVVYLPLLFATEEKVEFPPFVVRVEKVKFDFSERREDVKVNSFDSEIRTIKFSGYAPFVSKELAGITGEFSGWLSDDWARVPIKATFNTFLGVVRLELSKWEKSGWNPPFKTK